jgi:hypothetical protein
VHRRSFLRLRIFPLLGGINLYQEVASIWFRTESQVPGEGLSEPWREVFLNFALHTSHFTLHSVTLSLCDLCASFVSFVVKTPSILDPPFFILHFSFFIFHSSSFILHSVTKTHNRVTYPWFLVI